MKINLNKQALLEYISENQPIKKSYREMAEIMKFQKKRKKIKYETVFFNPTRQAIFLILKELEKEGKITIDKGEYKLSAVNKK